MIFLGQTNLSTVHTYRVDFVVHISICTLCLIIDERVVQIHHALGFLLLDFKCKHIVTLCNQMYRISHFSGSSLTNSRDLRYLPIGSCYSFSILN
ncbi:hypothetical protein AQUCO_03000149v1 [Aquilegia coerulea]|uniref:Uncharacterized protein n=1 Tax=Aquilegia coerulea TaxID=218851 RepID=A0A2G5D1F9_AQUCA|nr:hypothetical protein AQUCO_03000149v1 [Aquilegia coerulea]